MKSTNPIFNESVYEQAYALTEKPMTVAGTMNKLLILSLIMMISAAAVYYQFSHYCENIACLQAVVQDYIYPWNPVDPLKYLPDDAHKRWDDGGGQYCGAAGCSNCVCAFGKSP